MKPLGTIGIVYTFVRMACLTTGTLLRASLGKLYPNVRSLFGFGNLYQSGVAICLTLALKQQLSGLGPAIINRAQTLGDEIGQTYLPPLP